MGITSLPSGISNPLATKTWYAYTSKTNNAAASNFGQATKMAFGNGTYAFCTSSGYVFSSLDGKTWNQTRVTTNSLYGIAFGNGAWVVVGQGNTCFSATNPAGSWTARTSQVNGTRTLFDVAWIPNWNLFVLAGGTDAAAWNMISTSPDGTTWTARAAMPGSASADATNIAWDGASTVVIGENGTVATQGWSSTNGTSWTRIDINGGVTIAGNGPITYYGGAYGKFITDVGRNQTPASVTTAWSLSNQLSTYQAVSPNTQGQTGIQWKGWQPYFDTSRNYCYQLVQTGALSSNQNAISALYTYDTSVIFTDNTSSPSVSFPVIKTEIMPMSGAQQYGNSNFQNNFYAFLNNQHFYISSQRTALPVINTTIV